MQVEMEQLRELTTSAVDYLMQAEPAMAELAKAFYGIPEQGAWSRFNEMIEGIEWINQLFTVLSNSITDNHILSVIQKHSAELQAKTLLISDALKRNDHTLIGDLIQYELAPLYRQMAIFLQEGVAHVFS